MTFSRNFLTVLGFGLSLSLTGCGGSQSSAPEPISPAGSSTAPGSASPDPVSGILTEEKAKTEAPKADAPKAEASKTEVPKAETPKIEAPKTEAPKADAPKADSPKIEAPKGAASLNAEEKAEIAKLGAKADQDLALAQATCLISGENLGSMGVPIKVSAEGKSAFLCCKGCVKDFEKDPKAALAKLAK